MTAVDILAAAVVLLVLLVPLGIAIVILLWRNNGRWQMAKAPAAPVPMPAPRIIPNGWATVLSDARFVQVWQEMGEKDERYLAVQQLLAREALDAIDYACRPELADQPGKLANATGAMLALIKLAGDFELARTAPENWTALEKKTQRRRGAE